MYFKIILGLGVLCAWSDAIPCNCGLGSGKDICNDGGGESGGCVPLVIRPVPYINIPTPSKPKVICKTIGVDVPPLKPLVGLCSCGQTVITPAHNPVPVCRACSGSSSSSSGSSSSSSGSSSSSCSGSSLSASSVSGSGSEQISSSSDDEGSLASIAIDSIPSLPGSFLPPHLCSVPADPVSQALALREQLRNQNIPRNSAADRDISFGFQKLPVELISERKKAAVAEGNLQKINGEVLELKLAPCAQKSIDQEAIEDLLIVEDEAPEECAQIRSPSLGELGYISAKVPPGKFVDIEVEDVKPSCAAEVQILPFCKDGYRPGQVIVKEGPNEPISYPSGLPRPICLDNEPNLPPRNVPPYVYSSSSSSSSSSSAASSSSSSQSAASGLVYGKPSCGCS